MDFYSNSDQQVEKVDDEEYKERDYATRQIAEREPEERGYKRWMMGRQKVNEESEAGVYSPSRSRSSNKKKKGKMFSLKLVFKIFIVAAVCYNFIFIWNFMKILLVILRFIIHYLYLEYVQALILLPFGFCFIKVRL